MDSSDMRGEKIAGQVQREAARNTLDHTGPTADRYANALAHYVSAVAGRQQPQPVHPHVGFPPLIVADVMATSVVSAYEGALFKEIAHALHRNNINAVPVINADRHVVGVVTASDLLARIEHHPVPPRGHRSPQHATRQGGPRAGTAAALMSSPALTATPGTSIAEAARLLTRYRIRSMPVVDRDGVLVGMVSRNDLIKLFLRDDEDIRRAVERHVIHPATSPAHPHVDVTVDEGVVTLSGHVDTALTARGLVLRATEVPGVLDVQDRLEFDINDLYLPMRH